jgi:KTSC domain
MDWFETPESSNILRFRYEAETLTLEIEFKNGNIYQYFDVPEPVYEAFCQAGSKGEFFVQSIRGAFRYARC